MVGVAQEIVHKAKTDRQLRSELSITNPKIFGANNAITAKALGGGLANVVRMQKEIRDQVADRAIEKGSWGGRRHQYLSIENKYSSLNSRSNSLNRWSVGGYQDPRGYETAVAQENLHLDGL